MNYKFFFWTGLLCLIIYNLSAQEVVDKYVDTLFNATLKLSDNGCFVFTYPKEQSDLTKLFIVKGNWKRMQKGILLVSNDSAKNKGVIFYSEKQTSPSTFDSITIYLREVLSNQKEGKIDTFSDGINVVESIEINNDGSLYFQYNGVITIPHSAKNIIIHTVGGDYKLYNIKNKRTSIIDVYMYNQGEYPLPYRYSYFNNELLKFSGDTLILDKHIYLRKVR